MDVSWFKRYHLVFYDEGLYYDYQIRSCLWYFTREILMNGMILHQLAKSTFRRVVFLHLYVLQRGRNFATGSPTLGLGCLIPIPDTIALYATAPIMINESGGSNKTATNQIMTQLNQTNTRQGRELWLVILSGIARKTQIVIIRPGSSTPYELMAYKSYRASSWPSPNNKLTSA